MTMPILLPELGSVSAWRFPIRCSMNCWNDPDEVAYISYHDSLTGLYNRNYFNQETSRHSIPAHVCAFVCDIDGLKRVNDDYGHAWGDEPITAAGRVLKKPGKLIWWVRVGGDEFYIIAYDCDLTAAANLQQRIFSIISNHNHSNADAILKLSLSVGYCHVDETNQQKDQPWTWEALLHQADQRMYAQKTEKKSK